MASLFFISAPGIGNATSAEQEVAHAAAVLSHYPAGGMRLDAEVVEALSVLGRLGGANELSLLQNVYTYERDSVARFSIGAISDIRKRRKNNQRRQFAKDMPSDRAFSTVANHYVQDGLGYQSAECAAYALLILQPGENPILTVTSSTYSAEELLTLGLPSTALSVAKIEYGGYDTLLPAQAHEDLGDMASAVSHYAKLAIEGSAPAVEELSDFGIDTERLLLGLLFDPTGTTTRSFRSDLVARLVETGGIRTIAVLSELSLSEAPFERAIATDALGEMLAVSNRRTSVTSNRDVIRRALLAASTEGPEPLRAIALEALR